ncbi:MAG: ROK family transcriptional regulator [SAR324 cluster bacterium]|nr:ROK family transcriptional regulator [SAR324 cluster bacterium]
MAVANRELIREINQFSILNTIRTSNAISRVEIARITGISRASVTGITARLISENLIFEKEIQDSSLRGRRRVMLALNPDAVYVVGVKISAFKVSFAVTNMEAGILSSLAIPIQTGKRPVEYIANLIEDGIRHCVEEAQLQLKQISGIGIGIPGFIDSRSGICHWTPLYQKGEIPLRDLIQERLKISTYIENDANTITLGEQWFGQGKGIDNFIVVTIEHGIGMGIVINSQMYRGVKSIGAECGHMVLIPEGTLCRCGKKGCLEAYVSDVSILELARQAHADQKWHADNIEQLTIEKVTALAQKGQPVLRSIFKKAGEILGIGLSNLIHIFNPERIIITGEGVRAGDMLFVPMREAVNRHSHHEMLSSAKILIQKWDDTDWARGAASLVLQELYKSPLNRIKPTI